MMVDDGMAVFAKDSATNFCGKIPSRPQSPTQRNSKIPPPAPRDEFDIDNDVRFDLNRSVDDCKVGIMSTVLEVMVFFADILFHVDVDVCVEKKKKHKQVMEMPTISPNEKLDCLRLDV